MEEKIKNQILENTTKYGEFISSFHGWLTFEDQKERAKHLENIAKESKME